MARTPKVLRTAKKAGATRVRVAGKMDDVKRGGKPPRPATVARKKAQTAKTMTELRIKGTVSQRRSSRAKSIADTQGMVAQMNKNDAKRKKRSVVAPGIRTKPAAKKAPAEKPAAGRATPFDKDTYSPGAKGAKKGYKMNSKYEKGLSLKGRMTK
jgi:hypothetical protein